MEPVVLEPAGAWPKIRNLLVAVGDVVGVLVLIAVIAIIGSHEEIMGSMAELFGIG
ncbi:hypothetical protein [Nocardia sp. NPDC052566]|uniref:hypothetical protein n=1 Tax=Nocardia sp. NPDC052566 TaxID=3364330 RepID=UPI0037C9CB43